MVRHLARSVKLEEEHPAHRATPLATHNSAKVLKNKIKSKQNPQKRIKNFGERAAQKRKPQFFLHLFLIICNFADVLLLFPFLWDEYVA